jgi:hypothetical protein
LETLDGREIIERLEAIDNAKRSMRYTSIAGMRHPITPARSK